MDNLNKGSQSKLSAQKPSARRTVSSKDTAIPLHAVTKEDAQNRERHNFFYYQRGRTKIECSGNNKKAIQLALVDTICRWLIRLLIAGASIAGIHYFSN